MKTTVTRAAAIQSKPRLQIQPRPAAPPTRPDWAWPGLTRSELRELIIEQIG